MKIKFFIIFAILITGLFFSVSHISAQQASGPANVTYPVAELGNCKSDTDCKAYCDKPKNTTACLNFAQKNNLMTAQEIDTAKKFLAAKNTPGGCIGKVACDTYCSDISHINECVPFAEKNNLLPADQLQQAQKVQAAIASGVKPPPCANKTACDTYCQDPNHMQECITFGEATGFLHGQDLVNAKKVLAAIQSGVKQPPCQSKEACDAYCSNPDTAEACMNFSIAAGLMTDQEKADSQKMLQAIKSGIKPPNCQGKEACDAYCQDPNHMDECTKFAVAAGFMTEQDAQISKKTGGKGPGGCVGKDACDTFCNNPDNQETCMNFAKDNGMLSQADLNKMGQGKQQMQQSLQQAPPEVITCLNSAIGTDMVGKIKNGFMPPQDIGEKMRTCFQNNPPPQTQGPGAGGMIPPAGQTGPGGCKTADECKAYCGDHPDECKNFGSNNNSQQSAPGTAPGGNQPGPGGCKTPEECQKYCKDNPDNCKNFQPGPGQVNPGGQTMPQQAGPGGCKTPEECKTYCTDHPDECKNFQQSQNQQPQQQLAPGTEPIKCEGSDCPQPPPSPNSTSGQQQYAPGTGPAQCQGDNCTPPPLPPGTSTEPGAGGNINPGQQVPQAQPTEQTPPPQNPPPGPSSFVNKNSLLGSFISAVFNFLTGSTKH